MGKKPDPLRSAPRARGHHLFPHLIPPHLSFPRRGRTDAGAYANERADGLDSGTLTFRRDELASGEIVAKVFVQLYFIVVIFNPRHTSLFLQ